MTGARRALRPGGLGVAGTALAAAAALGAVHAALLINAPAASGSIEWDFYYSYARDAKRIASLLPPLDEFRGPLYPLVLALLHLVLPFLTTFAVAKVVAALSAAGAVYASYLIAEELVEPEWATAVAVATAATGPFLLHGFLVGTDMFFACVCLFAVYAVLRAMATSATRTLAVAGALAGLAMTTRWNAAFVPAAGVVCLLAAEPRARRDRLRAVGLYLGAFAVAIAPWLALNAALHHGNPLFNRNYVNASLGIYDGGLSFDSLGAAVAYAPTYFAKRWAQNAASYAGRVGRLLLPLSALAVVGAARAVARVRARPAGVAPLVFAVALVVVNAIGPFVVRQYLVAIPLVLALAAAAAERLGALSFGRGAARPVAFAAWGACVAWLLWGGIGDVAAARDVETKQLASRSMVGAKPAAPLVGDWDGDGRDEVGVARDGSGYKVFYLWRGFDGGPADWIAAYGPERATPLVGRWRAGAPDGIGVFGGGSFFLKYRVFSGAADETLAFGDRDGAPVVGDWDGDGVDTVGTFRDGTWLVTDATAAPLAARSFGFGGPGTRAVVGDWDGDGKDTAGVYDPKTGVFTLTNRTAAPFDDAWTVDSTVPGGSPVAGDWDGDGKDSPVVFTSDGTFTFVDADGLKQYRVDLDRAADLPVAGE